MLLCYIARSCFGQVTERKTDQCYKINLITKPYMLTIGMYKARMKMNPILSGNNNYRINYRIAD